MEKICTTGHRPDKLGGYDLEAKLLLVNIAVEYLTKSIKLTKRQNTTIYIGMALGWDIAMATACDILNIAFIACVPFKGQELLWSKDDQISYKFLLSKAKEIIIVCEGTFAIHKMHIRNQYMVDNTTKVIAMWDGFENGGTWQCIKNAQSKYKQIVNLFPEYIKAKNDRT